MVLLMRGGVVRKTRQSQKVHACCAGRYGRQQIFPVIWSAATKVFLIFTECVVYASTVNSRPHENFGRMPRNGNKWKSDFGRW